MLESRRYSNPARPAETGRRGHIGPRAVTILGTYRCTAACKDCCFDSNPGIAGRLTLDRIIDFIGQAAELRSVRMVVFSGGECFLLGADLVKAVEFAAGRGLTTRCVTNGYWARSLLRGETILAPLRAAGLSELNISTGDFHQRFVSEETVVNAVELALACGMDRTLLVVELREGSRVTAANLLKNVRLRKCLEEHGQRRFGLIQSPWMPMDPQRVSEQTRGRLLSRDTVPARGGCHSIFTTAVLTPSNHIGVCCGLSRERIPELNYSAAERRLEDVLDEAGRDFIKIWLFVDGPERILAWAASKNNGIQWENRYAHHCHACLALFDDPRVRQTILEHYRERVDDVLLRYNVRLREQELLDGAVYG
jgi:Radical SAM superfamily